MGSSLRDRDMAEIYPPDDPATIVTFIKTLMRKVINLHRQGICHGDISHGNVALATHPDAFTPESLKETFESDRKSKVTLLHTDPLSETPPPRPNFLPEYMVARDGPPLLSDAEDMSLVDILDYGKAFEGASKEGVLGTSMYSAPEVSRDAANTTTPKSDLWSLGCVIAYFLTDNHLFSRKADYIAGNDEQQRAIILEHLQYFETEPDFKNLVVQLIRALVRVDPAARSIEQAQRILEQLERYIPEK